MCVKMYTLQSSWLYPTLICPMCHNSSCASAVVARWFKTRGSTPTE